MLGYEVARKILLMQHLNADACAVLYSWTRTRSVLDQGEGEVGDNSIQESHKQLLHGLFSGSGEYLR